MKLKKGIADLSFIIMIACDRNCNIEFARNKNLSSVAIYKCAHDARDKKFLTLAIQIAHLRGALPSTDYLLKLATNMVVAK